MPLNICNYHFCCASFRSLRHSLISLLMPAALILLGCPKGDASRAQSSAVEDAASPISVPQLALIKDTRHLRATSHYLDIGGDLVVGDYCELLLFGATELLIVSEYDCYYTDGIRRAYLGIEDYQWPQNKAWIDATLQTVARIENLQFKINYDGKVKWQTIRNGTSGKANVNVMPRLALEYGMGGPIQIEEDEKVYSVELYDAQYKYDVDVLNGVIEWIPRSDGSVESSRLILADLCPDDATEVYLSLSYAIQFKTVICVLTCKTIDQGGYLSILMLPVGKHILEPIIIGNERPPFIATNIASGYLIVCSDPTAPAKVTYGLRLSDFQGM